MANKYPAIINFIDYYLENGLLYRKIASKVRQKYDVCMSYQSIRRYDLYKQNLCNNPNIKEESDDEIQYIEFYQSG